MDKFSFNVVLREADLPRHQTTADVVRSDGKVVRTGLWPDAAEVDCKLLNEFVAGDHTAEWYHAERRARLSS